MIYVQIYLAICYLIGIYHMKTFLEFVNERKHTAPPGVTDGKIKFALILLFVFIPVVIPWILINRITK